ncbi:hypothetical protein [Coleofasciculus sp. LEGE 07092]|nr:hypothetical protein [Coleofasciculus sp. LEGE 07092]
MTWNQSLGDVWIYTERSRLSFPQIRHVTRNESCLMKRCDRMIEIQ